MARVHSRLGGEFASRGRPYALGLYPLGALVLFLLRQNVVQAVAGEVFGVSQATVSRRSEALREVVEQVLADLVPTPEQVAGASTVLVDGTMAATWDWKHRDDLFSGKRHDHGFNLQVAATLRGELIAVGAPVPGARHDTHAFLASGLAATLAGKHVLTDLGYVGAEDVLTGTKRRPGRELTEDRKQVNTELSALRAAVERAIGHLKNWKILGDRYRGPLHEFDNVVRTVVALAQYASFC